MLPGKRQNIALLNVTYNLVGEARKLACCMHVVYEFCAIFTRCNIQLN